MKGLLLQNMGIINLDLRDNDMTVDGMKLVAEGLEKSQILRKLNLGIIKLLKIKLGNNFLDDNAALVLSKVLCINKSLKILLLSIK